MILTGSVLLLLGVCGVAVSVFNRATTGWAGTRLKFVVKGWGLIASGITVLLVGTHRLDS